MKLSTAITLSCPLEKKEATCTVQALNSEIAHTIDHFSTEEWDKLVDNHQSFLKHAYLKGIQSHQSDNEYFYVRYSNDTGPVGCAVFQLVKVTEGMRIGQEEQLNGKLLNVAKTFFNKQTFRILICGNALVTGNYGFSFDIGIDQKKQIASIIKTIEDIKKKTKVDMVIIKDFENLHAPSNHANTFAQIGYTSLLAQPNMLLELRPNWESFDDYMGDMTSKARTRVKKNIKKGKAIFRKDLSLEEVRENNELIYEYYRTVADRVDFNLSTVGTDYFLKCKETMGDDFRILGYYLENRLVGFISLALSEPQVESHFIGFDQSLNRSNALYPNILIDQIKFTIEETKATSISFGRTALEIKSSFGAEPKDLVTVGWAKNPIYNRFIPKFFANLASNEEWVQRKPFKEAK